MILGDRTGGEAKVHFRTPASGESRSRRLSDAGSGSAPLAPAMDRAPAGADSGKDTHPPSTITSARMLAALYRAWASLMILRIAGRWYQPPSGMSRSGPSAVRAALHNLRR